MKGTFDWRMGDYDFQLDWQIYREPLYKDNTPAMWHSKTAQLGRVLSQGDLQMVEAPHGQVNKQTSE